MQKIKFVIIAEPRTGSNNFIDNINSCDDIECHRELYHPDSVYFNEESRFDLVNLRNDNPVGFFIEQFNLSTKKAFGFKIFNNHNNLFLENILNDVSFKKIILYRSNYLSVYSSEKIAELTKEYLQKTYLNNNNDLADTIKCSSIKIDFDEDDFLYRWKMYENFYKSTIDSLNKSNQSYLFVTYEDSINMLLFRRVFSWLGVSQPESISSSFYKQNTNNIISRFKDEHQVSDFIRRLGRPFWENDYFIFTESD